MTTDFRAPFAASAPSPSSIPPPDKVATRAIGKRPRLSGFARVLLGATVVTHVPMAFAVAEVARRLGRPSPWAWGLAFSALGVLGFWTQVRVMLADAPRAPWRVRLLELPYFVHWCACLLSVAPSVVAALGAPALRAFGVDASAAAGAMWSYGTGLVICSWGVFVRRRWFVVEHVDVAIQDLPSGLEGFRIAHLSDLHIGAYTPAAWGERWVRAANEARPDIAVVTGDLVASGSGFYERVATVVGGLRARHGAFVSMGNHDYFGDGERLVALIDATGTARVLRNAGRVFEHDGERLCLAAIDDTWTHRDDLGLALAERPDGVPTVLLAHDPERFRAAAKLGVDLVLSGHTHGGQVGMPFSSRRLNLSKMAHHYALGLYTRGKSTLYVHPGLGVTGPPIRVGIAPAVVVITLRRA